MNKWLFNSYTIIIPKHLVDKTLEYIEYLQDSGHVGNTVGIATHLIRSGITTIEAYSQITIDAYPYKLFDEWSQLTTALLTNIITMKQFILMVDELIEQENN